MEVTAHVGDTGHHVPSLKFVGLPMSKMWVIFGHGIKRSGDLDFLPLRSLLMSVMHSIGIPSLKFVDFFFRKI